jgi:hypothetical protein
VSTTSAPSRRRDFGNLSAGTRSQDRKSTLHAHQARRLGRFRAIILPPVFAFYWSMTVPRMRRIMTVVWSLNFPADRSDVHRPRYEPSSEAEFFRLYEGEVRTRIGKDTSAHRPAKRVRKDLWPYSYRNPKARQKDQQVILTGLSRASLLKVHPIAFPSDRCHHAEPSTVSRARAIGH